MTVVGDPAPAPDVATAKRALRAEMLAARSAFSAIELAADARATTERVLALPEVTLARCVASYVSVGTEPGTRHLLDVLAARGVLVLVPVVLADRELDWAEYDGPGDLEPAAHGLLEPAGGRLGVDAVGRADVVLVPALAVDRDGARLGKGGGYYDRALTHVRRPTLVCALVHDAELLPAGATVPTAAHDRRVDAVVTPTAVHRVKPERG